MGFHRLEGSPCMIVRYTHSAWRVCGPMRPSTLPTIFFRSGWTRPRCCCTHRMSLLEALWCDSAGRRSPGGLVVAGGAVVVGAALVEGPVLVAGAAVGSLARWLPAQAAKASTAAMAKAASPPIRGVCLVLRDPPVVASAPDLLSTVDLLPPRSLIVCLSLEPISSDAQ